jgi:hypothetical protein
LAKLQSAYLRVARESEDYGESFSRLLADESDLHWRTYSRQGDLGVPISSLTAVSVWYRSDGRSCSPSGSIFNYMILL